MRKAQYSIDFIKQISEDRGGRCISDEYVSDNEKLKFQCSKGHTWMAAPIVILQGGWCPQCAKENDNLQKLEILKQIAKERDGECLSEIYKGAHSKIKWQCKEGHIWESQPCNVKSLDNWCPYCAGTARLTIEEIKELAETKGGKCLSSVYVNIKTKLLWQCAKGHQWKAVPNSIRKKNGTWCPYCAGKLKKTIEQIHKVAESRGGKCLSNMYINKDTKMLWQCAKGHQWEAVSGSILNSRTWCPYCAGTSKLTIKEMHEHAESNGGKCLSNVYINTATKLLWECSEGHHWKATPRDIKHNNSWCPICVGRNKNIEDMRVIAERKGGKCLSEKYIDNSTKLLWQCSVGHKWEAIPNSINKEKGSWCPYCYGNKKLTIKEMHELAESKGGKCLSNVYVNSNTKLLWQCAKGHQWKAVPNNIKYGETWCPVCYKIERKSK